jgi:hypothetical protein
MSETQQISNLDLANEFAWVHEYLKVVRERLNCRPDRNEGVLLNADGQVDVSLRHLKLAIAMLRVPPEPNPDNPAWWLT